MRSLRLPELVRGFYYRDLANNRVTFSYIKSGLGFLASANLDRF